MAGVAALVRITVPIATSVLARAPVPEAAAAPIIIIVTAPVVSIVTVAPPISPDTLSITFVKDIVARVLPTIRTIHFGVTVGEGGQDFLFGEDSSERLYTYGVDGGKGGRGRRWCRDGVDEKKRRKEEE